MKSEHDIMMNNDVDLSKYIGEWIVVIGNKVVAHGEDAKLAYEKARKLYPKKIPYIIKIPKESIMLL